MPAFTASKIETFVMAIGGEVGAAAEALMTTLKAASDARVNNRTLKR